jgi:AhpD family alkylhydroperoxidase
MGADRGGDNAAALRPPAAIEPDGNPTHPRRTIMTTTSRTLRRAALAAALAAAGAQAQPAPQTAADTYRDIEATLGLVPEFFRAYPEAGIPGAWSEFKSLQLSDKTALGGKTKQLIQLGVSAQMPCTYCVYFHTAAARAYGATDAEIREAVAMAAITRHWSTVLNGMAIDIAGFRNEVDTVMRLGAEKAAKAK